MKLMQLLSTYNWKTFSILFALGLTAYAIQVVVAISELQLDLPIIKIAGFIILRVIGISMVVFLGLLAAVKIDIYKPNNRAHIKTDLNLIFQSILIGLLLGISLLFTNQILFEGILVNQLQFKDNMWTRLMISFSAAIGEELLYRLFVMSIISWAGIKLTKSKKIGLWMGIIISSFLFGLGHIPNDIQDLNVLLISRALFLNGMAGLLLGWLFWKKGLQAAVVTHLSADIVIHVIFIEFKHLNFI